MKTAIDNNRFHNHLPNKICNLTLNIPRNIQTYLSESKD